MLTNGHLHNTGRPALRNLFTRSAAVFLLFALLAVIPAAGHSAGAFTPSFGEGRILVRLYTD